MRRDELKRLVESTRDPAFAVDSDGVIAAWNAAAEELFGRPASATLGQRCRDIVNGSDECGAVCSENCAVRQSIEEWRPLGNFDLHVETASGKQWCNVSVLSAEDNNSTRPYAIHIVRPSDLRKRLEILVRDFVVSKTNLAPENAAAMIATTPAPSRDVKLTPRELEILKMIAGGVSNQACAAQLNISRTTVNNHVQHILRKLGVQSRLEAIRRAERAGLI